MKTKTLGIAMILMLAILENIHTQNLSINLTGSPDFTYRLLGDQELRDDYEKGQLRYRGGIDIDKPSKTLITHDRIRNCCKIHIDPEWGDASRCAISLSRESGIMVCGDISE
ncbi:hypothetical protein GCM10007940_45820 [Portibacter lacus]|uniref:Uncharacterized protein n=1 Tax=Portibacter lacus TaxID=1099794 RepID=A0AA37SS67_9BACT|nr:hypothetical protein GCM10007940_45820 [Portibacter lacus]